MNYWLTTHWPPREDKDPLENTHGIYLPDGRETAGYEIARGDKVLIYQSRTGRAEIRRKPDGSKIVIKSILRREGIIAICMARSGLYEFERSEPSHYVDGTTIWWRWYTPLKLLSKSGFIPREEINRILGYKLNYNFRGFGELHSGLKRLTEERYTELLKRFRGTIKSLPIRSGKKKLPNHKKAISGVVESQDHFLLKHYVAANPSEVLQEPGVNTFKVEYSYPTGDRADVLLVDQTGRIIAVEIEVDVRKGQLEGILQAIKYRYMAEVMTKREPGDSQALLVAYSISDKIRSVCKKYSVQCVQVSRKKVLRWSQTDFGRKIAEQYNEL